MYRVVTYRSKLLKKNTISLDDVSATDSPVADFDEEEVVGKKKKRKKADDQQIFVIDGVEVSEEDLTPDEKLDIEANALLNQDGFYNALLPLDYDEKQSDTKRDKVEIWKLAIVVLVTTVILAGIVVAMVMLR